MCFLPKLRHFYFKELELLECSCLFPKKMKTFVRFWYKNKVKLFLSPEINIKLKRIRILVISSYFLHLKN